MRAIEYLQLDPLQIIARSHDIQLYNRVLEYAPGMWEEVTYQRAPQKIHISPAVTVRAPRVVAGLRYGLPPCCFVWSCSGANLPLVLAYPQRIFSIFESSVSDNRRI
jgi:hypothetical protein